MSDARPKARIIELDLIRAGAALIVMITHFAAPLFHGFPAATLGRQMLLVMSGFFATQILLLMKARMGSSSRVPAALRSFFKRRFLRLYPIYAFVLIASGCLLYFLGDHRVLGELGWHLPYGSNYLVFIRGDWGDVTGHLWTLSAIEQFYLLWPLVVLYSSRAAKIRTGCILFWLGVASNLATALWLADDTSKVLLPNCLPFLSLGALLALDRASPDHEGGVLRSIIDRPWIGGLLVALCVWNYDESHPFFVYGTNMGWALALPGLLSFCLKHTSESAPGRAKRFFAYLGQASFVIYLVHPFVRQALRLYFEPRGYPVDSGLFVATMIALSIATAALLHEVVEKPLQQLRSRVVEPVVLQPVAAARQNALNLPS